jgi:hypothetical protein
MTARLARVTAGRAGLRLLVLALVLLLVAALAWRTTGQQAEARRGYSVPENATMEAQLGVRFVQAAVVADGGLVELRYTVLDAQKASAFQRKVHNPPTLRSEKRTGSLYRTALMRQGHDLRPGQDYYILYLNNKGAVRSGETMEIDAGGQKLAKVPVR